MSKHKHAKQVLKPGIYYNPRSSYMCELLDFSDKHSIILIWDSFFEVERKTMVTTKLIKQYYML